MPQSKEVHREYMRKRRKGSQGVTEQGITSKGVTDVLPIIRALADSVKKEEIERIAKSLKAHNVAGSVSYGVSGPTFLEVGDMLDILSKRR